MGLRPERLRLLAALLAQPEDDALDALRDQLGTAPWLAPAIAELEALPLTEWQGEHTRLFVNGYPRTPCPPFESAYRHGQMGGSAREELSGLYARAGLRATGAPPDYLGTLLEYAAFLTEQCTQPAGPTEARTGEDPPGNLLAALWEEHLSTWLPRFASDLRDAAALELYRILGAQIAELAAGQAHDRSRT